MKRRRKTVTNRDTKVQLALVNMPNNTEKKALVIDHLRNIGFVEDDNGSMQLSIGVFNNTLTKYSSIKRLISGNFSVGDSDIINKAIIGASMKPSNPKKVTEEPEDTHTTLNRETACYNHAVVCAKKLSADIKNLQDAGVPREYLLSRYPSNIEERLSNIESLLAVQRLELAAATEKVGTIKNKIAKLQQQLKDAEYEEYICSESLISALRSCTESIDFVDDAKRLIQEDLAELNKLKRIKELEEELASLKADGKFSNSNQPEAEEHELHKKKEKVPVELEVELPTEKQEKQIRFLSNHLYQVRRGNEKHNPVICRKIAELSAELKLTKAEFCKKVLSISVQCWDSRHREYFASLGMHLHGERRPTDSDSKKDYKDEIKRWASIHIIASDGNDVLNTDVYNAFIKDTSSDIAKISFYNILARSLGYKPKCKYRRENGKTRCDTYYVGYRLV